MDTDDRQALVRVGLAKVAMSTVTEIEAAIKKLPPAGVEELIDWLDEYRDMPHASAEVVSPDNKAADLSTVSEIEIAIKNFRRLRWRSWPIGSSNTV